MIDEPKVGCEILCEAEKDGVRGLRVFSIRRPRFRPEWRITADCGAMVEVRDWGQVLDFLSLTVRATSLEVSEFDS